MKTWRLVSHWLMAIACVLSIGTGQAMYWQFVAKDLPTWRIAVGAIATMYCCFWCLQQAARGVDR